MDPQTRFEANQLMQRADLLMVDGDNATAKDLLAKAVEIDPENAEARRMLAGVTARMAGVSLDATDAGKDEMSREASDLVASAERAKADGNFRLAESLLRRALAIDPDNAEARHELVNVENQEPLLTELERQRFL